MYNASSQSKMLNTRALLLCTQAHITIQYFFFIIPAWKISIGVPLKGKFSSGIEGALASTLNHDFNWKQLSKMILCIFFFDVFKVYLSNIDSETAEKKEKDTLNFGRGHRTLVWFEI